MESLSTTQRKIAKIFSFSVIGGIFGYALFFVIAWSTFEVSGIERNSLTFYFAAPNHLNSVELIGECKKPEYQWKGRDGEGVPFSSIEFGSTSSIAQISDFYETVFSKQICKSANPKTASNSKLLLDFNCKNESFVSVKVFIDTKVGCKNVTIDFVENN